jgi:hypothetical protein
MGQRFRSLSANKHNFRRRTGDCRRTRTSRRLATVLRGGVKQLDRYYALSNCAATLRTTKRQQRKVARCRCDNSAGWSVHRLRHFCGPRCGCPVPSSPPPPNARKFGSIRDRVGPHCCRRCHRVRTGIRRCYGRAELRGRPWPLWRYAGRWAVRGIAGRPCIWTAHAHNALAAGI